MLSLNTGIFLFLGVSLLIYLGLLHRVLERMYLTPLWALIILLAMFLGSYLPAVPFFSGQSLDVGGGIIPLGLVLYILIRSGSSHDVSRVLLVSGIVFSVVSLTDRLLPVEPGVLGYDLDPLFVPAITAAFSAYLIDRSRRAAFCGAVLGVFSADVFLAGRGMVHGGGGLFDVIIISGILAVLLTEIVGEINERLKNRMG